MPKILLLGLILAQIAGSAGAATLTITPDKATYQVGEQITLNVFGDAEGMVGSVIFGSILFDAALATYITSEQEPLSIFGGTLTWTAGTLLGGEGFGWAFNQFESAGVTEIPLVASVTLLATAPGTLNYSWDINESPLFFFFLTNAAGGSVLIVPEPGTSALLGFGLIVVSMIRRMTN